MKHFLITRFNIKSKNWKQTKSGNLTNSQVWLDQRFFLFQKYCLPSVQNQNNQNFKWILVFDINTPKISVKKIQEIKRGFPLIKIIFTKDFGTLTNDLNNYIRGKITDEDEYIITTRLDNDDAIHSYFINTIQHLFIAKHNTIIDLTKGYQLNIQNADYDLKSYTCNYNPFLSLIEKSDQFNTVMAKNHDHWKTLPNTITHKKQHLWIQVIHSENILNQKINSLRKVSHLDFDAFGLSKEKICLDTKNVILTNVITAPLRFINNLKRKLKNISK